MKITIVGGGSYAWMPSILPNIVNNDYLSGSEIVLYDLSETALAHTSEYGRRLAEARPESRVVFTTASDLNAAVDGADYLVMAISQGGLRAELDDHVIARKYGYYNLKGSEVGIAGASRTLRHVREAVRIAKTMEDRCPGAFFLNVTNPLSAITRSVNKYTGIKAAGFCHGVVNHTEMLMPFFGAERFEDIEFNVAGIDHCSWLLDLRFRGQDALEIIRRSGLVEIAKTGASVGTYNDPFAGEEHQRLRLSIFDFLGYIPGFSDEHIVVFFGELMGSGELRKHYMVTYDRIAERTRAVSTDKQEFIEMLDGKLPLRTESSAEIIDRFIAALEGGGSFVDVVNYPNFGQICNLPDEMVVETLCHVSSTGVHPVITGGLPPILESIVRPAALREELYMQAGIEEDIAILRAALATDPLVHDFRQINEICEELMRYNIS